MIAQSVETLDGWYALHMLYNVDWHAWNTISKEEKQQLLAELFTLVEEWEQIETKKEGSHYLWNVTGHKGDFSFFILRPELGQLNEEENRFRRLGLYDYLTPVHSYVSVIELGTYSGMPKTEAAMKRTNQHLYPELPKDEYICFYPMNKVRSGDINWYTLSYEKRQELMKEHGMIGRKYAGKIRQFITGSIGFDDHEWGVTLFANDPLEFKKIIYEMRFSEASSVYSDFPYFIVGTSLNDRARLTTYFQGK
ncbi:hydrogen peroxide-dependent heme synthase [Enterococcus bulliens]|uniref:hydrogen peroxide-dependent heme synthase n=1 Tax=uncultured Enterococcus sp. TaxID=167972 RepID=UPI00345C589C